MPKKIFVCTALIGALVPVFFVINLVGGIEHWNGVMPRGVTDSLYYYARIHEVADGYPLVGNPYLYEHRQTYSPAFFLTDVISALPLYIGIPFDITVILNVFVWSFIFLYLAHKLLTILAVPQRWAVFWTLFLYLGSYSFMLRPVVMQIIFPLFFCFLIAFLLFLFEPKIRKRSLLLAFVSATTFYFYSYLSFIVFFTLASVFFWSLFSKRMTELRALTQVGLYTTVFLIPFFIYSYVQMSNPLYAETLMRLGLVHTRIPAIEAFYFGRWIIIGLCAFALLWFFFSSRTSRYVEKRVFWVSTGLALLIGLFMNVITGVELTLAIHVGRFVILWMLIVLGVVLSEWYFLRAPKRRIHMYIVHAVIGVFVLLLMVGAVNNIPRALAFFNFNDRGYNIEELQSYARPLTWINEHVEEPTVIWTNISMSTYIPLMTKHYVLFHNSAVLHLVSSKELEERYLLWRSLNHVTTETLKGEFDLYAGAGPHKEQPLAQNNYVKVCQKLKKIILDESCPEMTDSLSLRGEAYFQGLFSEYKNIQDGRENLLRKYGVSHLIIDTHHDTYDIIIPESEAVYNDGRFLIFKLEDILSNTK